MIDEQLGPVTRSLLLRLRDGVWVTTDELIEHCYAASGGKSPLSARQCVYVMICNLRHRHGIEIETTRAYRLVDWR